MQSRTGWLISMSLFMAFWVAGDAARASVQEGGGDLPRQESSVIVTEGPSGEDMSWSPLRPGERLPFPEVRELVTGLARGGPEHFEKMIRKAYDLTTRYARNERHDLVFELSGFKTVYTPDALELRYGDIVSIDLPDRIFMAGVSMDRTTQDGAKGGAVISVDRRRGYRANWEPAPEWPDREEWRKRTLREVIELSKQQGSQPELARLRAVTSYRVIVTFEGIRRDYRAAFLWIGDVSGAAIESISGFEPVVNLVTGVFLEEVPPEAGTTNSQDPPVIDGSIRELSEFGTCRVYSHYLSTPLYERVGFDRHQGANNHRAASQINISCHCSSLCESICHPSFGFLDCVDTGGTVGGFHVRAVAFDLRPNNSFNAMGPQGASCSGTFACAFAQCPFPNCVFNIQFNAQGGLSTTPPGAAFWAFTAPQAGTCGGCSEVQDPPEGPQIPEENTPLLIALERGRPELTDLAGGVRFDLDVNGTRERLSWTTGDSLWAFLVLDRNSNDRIDNGLELFGNYTPQSLGSGGRNGYRALSEFDQAVNGGNGDGMIDARDQVFASLLLWLDENHDGLSQETELTPLSDEIARIGLDYRESRRRDRHGNQFRYLGDVWLANGHRSRSVDVFLLGD
jgi:hypothetical protein